MTVPLLNMEKQLSLLKMPNSLSKQKMPAFEKLLLMKIIGLFFMLPKLMSKLA